MSCKVEKCRFVFTKMKGIHSIQFYSILFVSKFKMNNKFKAMSYYKNEL